MHGSRKINITWFRLQQRTACGADCNGKNKGTGKLYQQTVFIEKTNSLDGL